MSYQRTEYNRTDRDDNQEGGWRSWFGLGSNKDRDDNDRGYSYSRTTTYRDQEPRTYYRGDRDEYTRGSSWDRPSHTSQYNTTADRQTLGGYTGQRGGYGYQTSGEYNTRNWQPSNDRDIYRSEMRYGGEDRDYPRYSGESTYRCPSRGYGFSGDMNMSRGGYGGYDRDYIRGESTYRGQNFGGDRSYPYGGETSRGYGFSGDYNRPTGGYSTSYRY